MRYVSTRGEAPPLSFRDAVLTGLAADGGLTVPDVWPAMTREEIAGLAGRPYTEVAYRVISRFSDDDVAERDLRRMIEAAYATFRHPAVTPLVQLDERNFVLELFHGPTLAFKDLAMQLLARLMDAFLEETGRRATIVGATSGDTGGAAIEAFRGAARSDVAILFPEGRVSDVQRRQMTTAPETNVRAIAVDGHFDDCQALVKAMFADRRFAERVSLSGVNSINWGRIVAQVVYYFVAGVALGAPHRAVSFTVPTGNFGNVFAGWVAAKMGLPIERLVVATNVNDILARAFETGRYETGEVVPTDSPSMDIQVSSNFERLLYEAGARDGASVRRAMESLRQSKAFTLEDASLSQIRTQMTADRASAEETREEMRVTLEDTGYLLDPHTAVALRVARRQHGRAPMVTLATAHPAKFPDAVEAATGVRPELPDWAANILTAPERVERTGNDLADVEALIENRTRAATLDA